MIEFGLDLSGPRWIWVAHKFFLWLEARACVAFFSVVGRYQKQSFLTKSQKKLKKQITIYFWSPLSSWDFFDFFQNPWSVAIVLPKDDGSDGTKLHCSGSILSPKFVLTAAHCFFSEYGPVSETNMVLIVGASQPTNKTALAIDKKRRLSQAKKIRNVLIHPSFDKSTVSAMYDLALVEIQGSFTFKKSIWPICVPDEERPREHHFRNGYQLVGFGTDISDSGQCIECLKSDQLNVKSTVYCSTIYGQILKATFHRDHEIVKTALPNNFDDDALICAKVIY